MKYVIQNNLLNDRALELINQAVIKNDIPHMYVGVVPFSHEITSPEPLEGTNYLPYGSTSLTMITHDLGWKGQYFNPDTFRVEVWNQHRDDMLNDSPTTTVEAAIKFLRTQPPESLWFTRPTEDLKTYSGQVIEAKECADWLTDAMFCASSGSYQLSPETPIVLDSPKNIQAEWRWFIVGGRVVDGSIYRLRGQLHKQHEDDYEVTNQAQILANKWLPGLCCVMDLALVNDEIKVIEFNTINSSGFYDHNIEKIIVALYSYANQ